MTAQGPLSSDVAHRSPAAGPAGISVCMVCRNEADRLEPALESVQWADEILLLDLASTDGSPQLAEACGARVIVREPVPIVEMVRNELADQASNDWILVLDPDERVRPGLAEELRQAARDQDIDAVILPRMNHDLGYPPSHPIHRYEPQLRMYRRDRVRWPEVPNALPQVPDDRVYRVPQRDELVLVHDRSRNIPEVLERSLRYAPSQAQSMIDAGQVFSARAMVATLGSHAYKQFVRGRALRDGVPGLLRAGLLVGFHFYVWAAFWQLSGSRRTSADDRYLRRWARVLDILRAAVRALGTPLRLVRLWRSG